MRMTVLPVLSYVIGERGGDYAAVPTDAECGQITEVVASAVSVGLGRIVTLYDSASTLYHIH